MTVINVKAAVLDLGDPFEGLTVECLASLNGDSEERTLEEGDLVAIGVPTEGYPTTSTALNMRLAVASEGVWADDWAGEEAAVQINAGDILIGIIPGVAFYGIGPRLAEPAGLSTQMAIWDIDGHLAGIDHRLDLLEGA